MIERHNLFSTPVWRTKIPELDAHRDELLQFFLKMWDSGQLQRHKYGYGYQTPSGLFDSEFIEQLPALKILRKAFRHNVMEILRERHNHTRHLPPEIYAEMAWVLVQTNEDWVSGPWHDHAPAMISACYYLQQPETETQEEGALGFQYPGSVNPFVPHVDYIKPKQGDFILFPSHLSHRPMPCPSAKDIRISINMDAFVHWVHWDENIGPKIHPDRYKEMLNKSL